MADDRMYYCLYCRAIVATTTPAELECPTCRRAPVHSVVDRSHRERIMDSERWEAIRAEGIWVSAMVVLLAPITYAALLFVETELCTGVDLWFKQGTWQLRYCQVSFPLRLAVTAMFAVLGGALGSFLARKRRVSGGRGRHVEHAVELHRIQASMERASNR